MERLIASGCHTFVARERQRMNRTTAVRHQIPDQSRESGTATDRTSGRGCMSSQASSGAASVRLLGAEQLVGSSVQHTAAPLSTLAIVGRGGGVKPLQIRFRHADNQHLVPLGCGRLRLLRLPCHTVRYTSSGNSRQDDLTHTYSQRYTIPQLHRVGRTRHDAGFLGTVCPDHHRARTFVSVRPRGKRAGFPHFRSVTFVTGS